MEKVLLQMKNIHKSFPGVCALDGVDFSLDRGEIHALLGENGAGKSTLIKVLGGIYTAEEGEIYIDGQSVKILNPNEAKKNGIAIIHQEGMLIQEMSIAENIFLGREEGGLFLNDEIMKKESQKLLDSFEMNLKSDCIVKNLTIAQQQMVEIIKAFSEAPKILVMDEPTSSITDKEVEFLFSTMRRLTEDGVGIIYISHKMSEIDEICDKVTVLCDGKYIGTKNVSDTTTDELISMMVGRELTNYYARDFHEKGKVVLKVENICDNDKVKGCSFCLHEGEILGFAGLIGAGRSELMKCIFGLTTGYEGKIFVDGKEVKIRSPLDAMKCGIALVPESRKAEALFPTQSVQYNATIEVLDQFIKGIFVDHTKEDKIALKYMQMLNVKTPSPEQKIVNLSGGNQQKVIIGRWLAGNPKILILDEPTRGIDIGAKAEIYRIMNELLKQGIAIIMISSEMPEVINMSDRVCVMRDGCISGILEKEELVQESIMQLAAQ